MSLEVESSLLHRFHNLKILVVGDILLDEYLWGHVQRISPEAPVPILKIERREYTLGGAGNVVKNLRSLGAKVNVISAVGEDSTGDQILDLLNQLGVGQRVIRDRGRKSSRKTRLMSLEHGQHVFRFDEESAHWIDAAIEVVLMSDLEAETPSSDAVLCSDYLKGILSERVLQSAIQGAKKHKIPIVIAPKDSHPEKYRDASFLVPNLKELMQLASISTDCVNSFELAAAELIKKLDIRSIVVTRGGEGISLFEKSGNSVVHSHVPTAARTVYDVTGAGDTFISMFTLAIAAGASHEVAAQLGNIAAGIVVGKRGTASVSTSEVEQALRRGAGA
jgi:rfaE bifunctional protein kinase chain/domain